MLISETLVEPALVADKLKVNRTTPWRWIRNGCPTPDGRLIKLEAVRAGRKYLTSWEAVQRFLDATTSGGQPPSTPPPAKRKARVDAAAKRLAAAGA